MFMMCQRIGRPPISTIGFGLRVVSSESRLPSPPARITAFMVFRSEIDFWTELPSPAESVLFAHPYKRAAVTGYRRGASRRDYRGSQGRGCPRWTRFAGAPGPGRRSGPSRPLSRDAKRGVADPFRGFSNSGSAMWNDLQWGFLWRIEDTGESRTQKGGRSQDHHPAISERSRGIFADCVGELGPESLHLSEAEQSGRTREMSIH